MQSAASTAPVAALRARRTTSRPSTFRAAEDLGIQIGSTPLAAVRGSVRAAEELGGDLFNHARTPQPARWRAKDGGADRGPPPMPRKPLGKAARRPSERAVRRRPVSRKFPAA